MPLDTTSALATSTNRPVRQYGKAGPVAIAATETDIFQAPALWSFRVDMVIFYNQSGSSVTVTGHSRPVGVAAGTTNEFVSQLITTKARLEVNGGWVLGPGDTISAIGDATGVTAWVSGEVVTEAKATQ